MCNVFNLTGDLEKVAQMDLRSDEYVDVVIVVVVAWALAGVTNALLSSATQAAAGGGGLLRPPSPCLGAQWPVGVALDDATRGSSGYTLQGDPSSTVFYDAGTAVAPAGDTNGDGVPDVVLAGHGAIYLVWGPVSSRHTLEQVVAGQAGATKGHRIDAPECSSTELVNASSAGDVDGDGLADVAVACGDTAFVLFGRRPGSPWPSRTSSLGRSSASVVLLGVAGTAAGVGDVDGDRLDDVAARSERGPVVVVRGRRRPLWPDRVYVTTASASMPNVTAITGALVRSFAGVGDVDGDGVGDVVVANAAGSCAGVQRSGCAYLVFGRRSLGSVLDLRVAGGVVAFSGSGEGDAVGLAVSGAGDVDDDGLADFVLCLARLPKGSLKLMSRCAVVFGNSTASSSWPHSVVVPTSKKALPAVRMSMVFANDFFFHADALYDVSASSAGDIDGDGVGDLVMCHSEVSWRSLCTVVLGSSRAGAWPARAVAKPDASSSPLAGRSTIVNNLHSRWAHARAAGALGDIDGDGHGDLLLAELGGPSVRLDRERQLPCSFVVRGSNSSGLPPRIDVGNIDRNGTGYTLDSTAITAHAGASVRGVGDVNNDSIDDVAITAPLAHSSSDRTLAHTAAGAMGFGRVYVRLGRASKVPSTVPLERGSAAVVGAEHGDLFGWSVSPVGDVNGDAVSDLLVGAPRGAGGAGVAYVVFGGSGLWAAGSVVRAADLDGTNGFAIVGVAPWRELGRIVNAAGDLNGDRLADVAVSCNAGDGSGGHAFIVFGRRQWPRNVSVADLDGASGFSLSVAGQSAVFSATGVGDVNGDGVADLAVGVNPQSWRADVRAHVVFGRPGPWDAELNASALNGTDGFTVVFKAGGRAGLTLATAGDTNGDSLADLVVGSSDGQSLIFGSSSAWPAVVDFTTLGQYVRLPLVGAVSSADLNGDGLSDVVGLANPNDHRAVAVVLGRRGKWPNRVEDSDLYNGYMGFELALSADEAFSGLALAGAGDCNGDGVGDLVFGFCDADEGVGGAAVFYGTYEPVPSRADGQKLALSAQWSRENGWDWLTFDSRRAAFGGTPRNKTLLGTTTRVTVFAENARGVFGSQSFTLRVVQSLGIDLGNNEHTIWFGGERGRETRLSPISVRTAGQTLQVVVYCDAAECWSTRADRGGGGGPEGVQWSWTVSGSSTTFSAWGSPGGINELLATLVARHRPECQGFTMAIRASDDLGARAEETIEARRDQDDDEGGYEATRMALIVGGCVLAGLVVASAVATAALVIRPALEKNDTPLYYSQAGGPQDPT
eukprot:m51a1_g8698 hypothetical protein (1287) ;mRNA; r:74395-79554